MNDAWKIIILVAVAGTAVYLAGKGVSSAETSLSGVSTLWIIPIVLIVAAIGAFFLL